MMLSTWEQVQRMQRDWPAFRVLQRNHRCVHWEGVVRPLSQIYAVRVCLYQDKNRGKSPTKSAVPLVTVIDPLLRGRSGDPPGQIPHHYPNPDRPELPLLCLYDPDEREWHSGLAVARTIIPWTIDWLACYEGWLATGEWTGGGRHG